MLVGITILVLGLNLRPAAFEVGVWIGITVVYLLVLFRITLPERSHLIEYSVVAAFIYEALIERRSQGRTVPVPALSAIALAAMVGTVDELIQYYLPNRHFDTTDIIFNILASVMAVVSIVILRRTRDTVEMMAQNRKSD